MMSVEHRSLSEELKETQKVRSEYFPLKVANAWGKLVEDSTNTRAKKINGLDGMLTVVALSMIVDGDTAVRTAFTLAFLGGATIGKKYRCSHGQLIYSKKRKL